MFWLNSRLAWQELGSILQHFAFHHQGALKVVTTWFASLQLLQHLLFAISNSSSVAMNYRNKHKFTIERLKKKKILIRFPKIVSFSLNITELA